jgi:hypothetical protein
MLTPENVKIIFIVEILLIIRIPTLLILFFHV